MKPSNKFAFTRCLLALLLVVVSLSLEQQMGAEAVGENNGENTYVVDISFRCNTKDHIFPLAVSCGDAVREVYECPKFGLIFKSVLVDGKPIVPRNGIFSNLSLARIPTNSRFFSYEISLNGLGCHDNDPDTEIRELNGLFFDIPEEPKSIEIIYYSRETQRAPKLCRAIFLFGENPDESGSE